MTEPGAPETTPAIRRWRNGAAPVSVGAIEMSRRSFLAVAGGASAGLLLGGCARNSEAVLANDPSVAAAERSRRKGAATHDFSITAGSLTADLGGLSAETWAYNGTLPGPEIRLPAGDVLRVRFTNDLPESTTIHWHGIALRNDMDGVPDVTQKPVEPGASFTYEFAVPDPGTFWFHPHFGMHLDRGLYAPLIVEDPDERGSYDREYTVILDDWIDGVGASPEETLAELRRGGGVHAKHLAAAGGGAKPTGGPFLGGEGAGDVAYPMNLLNGRRATDPVVFEAAAGERLRLRIINAGADTPFRVAMEGHRLTVTHTDGFAVEPVTVDTLVIGMAERYDVVVTVAGAGVFPLVALAEARGAQAMAIVRSGEGPMPPPNGRPVELGGKVLALNELRAAEAVDLGSGKPDRTHSVVLGGGEKGYVWTINGEAHTEDHAHGKKALKVRSGERVRLVFENQTSMFHPMHLHGHTFQVIGPGGRGARKDTAIVRPKERISVDFLADNPGQWMLHCHNLYHQQGGMMTLVSYEK